MLSEKKRQHLFFIEIPENNAKNSARQNVNYCVTNFLYTAARNQKADVADEEQYQPDRSRQECQMAGGAFPLSGKFCSELEQGKETLRMDKVNQVLALFGHKVGAVKNKYLAGWRWM